MGAEYKPVERRRISSAQWGVVGLAIALTGASIALHLLEVGGMRRSAAVFVGIPAAMAVAIALTPAAGTVTGQIVRALTVALLLLGVLAVEGLVCLVMAAPVLYLVGVAVGYPIDRARRRDGSTTRMYAFVLAPILLLATEGTTPATTLPRASGATAERVVAGSPEAVEAALAADPVFNRRLPLFLRLGFPRPVRATGSGLEPGDRRVIEFTGGGRVVLEVTRRGPGVVVFSFVEDTTPAAGWTRGIASEVRWDPLPPGGTRVRWTIRYERLLDPAWYFGPMQRYAVGRAAGYLIDTVARP